MAPKYKTITVGYGQSLADICMQYGGCYEYMAQLLADNPQLSAPTSIPLPGTKLKILNLIPKLNDTNQAVLAQYAQNDQQVATDPQPYLEAYAYADMAIDVSNLLGDNWRFSISYAPLTTFGALALDHLHVIIIFYTGGAGAFTTLVDDGGHHGPVSYDFSEGAGTYVVYAVYVLSNGQEVNCQCFVMVDDAGNIIRQANFNGFVDLTISGMSASMTADYGLTNCSLVGGINFIAFDGTTSRPVLLGVGSTIVNAPLPLYNEVTMGYLTQFDPAEWTDAGPSINSNFIGSNMFSITSIIE